MCFLCTPSYLLGSVFVNEICKYYSFILLHNSARKIQCSAEYVWRRRCPKICDTPPRQPKLHGASRKGVGDVVYQALCVLSSSFNQEWQRSTKCSVISCVLSTPVIWPCCWYRRRSIPSTTLRFSVASPYKFPWSWRCRHRLCTFYLIDHIAYSSAVAALADPRVWKGSYGHMASAGSRELHPLKLNVGVLWWKFDVYPFFPLIHDKCQGHKKPSPSLHLRDAFQVSCANQHIPLRFKKKGDWQTEISIHTPQWFLCRRRTDVRFLPSCWYRRPAMAFIWLRQWCGVVDVIQSLNVANDGNRPSQWCIPT